MKRTATLTLGCVAALLSIGLLALPQARAGVGKIRAVAAALLEDLGITTGGVYSGGGSSGYDDDAELELGSAPDVAIDWSTAQATQNGLVLGVDPTGPVVLTAYANRDKDHDHAATTNPTLFVQSATDPDTANDEWISLSHDGTNGAIEVGKRATGKGCLQIKTGYNNGSIFIGGFSPAAGMYITSNNNTVIGNAASIPYGVDSTVVIGAGASSDGTNGVAVGSGAVTDSDSVAIGRSATNGSGLGNVAIGKSASTSPAYYAVAVGYGSNATASSATAVGYTSNATATYAVSLGRSANASHSGAIALGAFAGTTAVEQLAVGSTTYPITDFGTGKSANNAWLSIKNSSELLSGLTGASVSTTSLVPAGCRLVYVVARVTTLITGATTFDVGDGTDVDRYGAAIALAAGTTVDETDATADPMSWSSSAQDVTLTANGSDFTAGAVRITAFYLDPQPPGS